MKKIIIILTAIGGLAWFAPAFLKHRQTPHFMGLDPVLFFGVLGALIRPPPENPA